MAIQNLEFFLAPLKEAVTKELTDKESLKKVTNAVTKGFAEVVNEFSTQWNELLKSLDEKPKEAEVKEYKTQIIKLADVVKVAKENLVEGSDGVAIIRQNVQDGMVVFLAYAKGDSFVSIDKNIFVKINGKSLDEELLSEFGNDSCIILS